MIGCYRSSAVDRDANPPRPIPFVQQQCSTHMQRLIDRSQTRNRRNVSTVRTGIHVTAEDVVPISIICHYVYFDKFSMESAGENGKGKSDNKPHFVKCNRWHLIRCQTPMISSLSFVSNAFQMCIYNTANR